MDSKEAAKDRSEHVERHGQVRETFLMHMLIHYLHDDKRFCAGVDEWLARWDAEDAAKAAEVEAELAAPRCGVCGGHVGHSLVCPHYAAAGELVTA